MERRFYLRGLGLGIAVTAVIMRIITSRDSGMSDKEIIARAKELGMVENTLLAGDNGDTLEETDTPKAGDTGTDAPGKENTSSAENESGAGGSAGAESAVSDGDVNEAESSPGTDTADEGTDADKTDGTSNEMGNQEAGLMANGSDEAGVKRPETAQEGESGPGSGAEPEESARDLITSATVKTITVNSGDGSHTVAKKLADAGVIISAETFDEFLCQNGYDKKLRTGTFSIPADASDEQIARIVTGAE